SADLGVEHEIGLPEAAQVYFTPGEADSGHIAGQGPAQFRYQTRRVSRGAPGLGRGPRRTQPQDNTARDGDDDSPHPNAPISYLDRGRAATSCPIRPIRFGLPRR